MLKAPGTDSAKHVSVNMQFDKLNGRSVEGRCPSFAFLVEKYRLVNPWNRRDDSNEPAFPGAETKLPGRDHWGAVQTVFFAGGGGRTLSIDRSMFITAIQFRG